MAFNNDVFYIKALQSLLNQKYKNHKVFVSGCCHKSHSINNIYSGLQGKVPICHIQDRIPVQASFNFTVKKAIEKFGPADFYLYCDSGIGVKDNLTLKKLAKLGKTEKYSLISSQINSETNHISDFKSHYVVPIGEEIPLIFTMFSHKWVETYKQLLPDIFFGNYVESPLNFMAAAIKTRWAINKDVIVNHNQGMDGSACLAEVTPWERAGNTQWCHPYLISSNEFMQRMTSEQAFNLGLGYAENVPIMLHDISQYDENGHNLNNAIDYINDNYFLPEKVFNYNNVLYEWI